MKNEKLLQYAALNALGVVVYTGLVTWFMFSAESWLGRVSSFWGPMAILLLLVLSVAVVGTLIFLRPIYLFLDGHKKEAVTLIVYTLVALVILTGLVILLNGWFGETVRIGPGPGTVGPMPGR